MKLRRVLLALIVLLFVCSAVASTVMWFDPFVRYDGQWVRMRALAETHYALNCVQTAFWIGQERLYAWLPLPPLMACFDTAAEAHAYASARRLLSR